MASYTQISIEDAQNILALYGKNDLIRLSPLSLGISNSNYRVELKNETVLLKISNDKNKSQLSDEQAILIYLRQLKYPYSLCPIPLINGHVIYEYGKYFGVLYPFVQGIPPGPSDFTCSEVGKALACLHQLNHDQIKLKNLRRHENVGFGGKEVREYTFSANCPSDFKETFAKLFPDKLSGFINTNFATGIIHGDLYYDNTLFDKNEISSVLDFEQAGIGEYILDLAISISGTCLEKGRLITPLIESYLEGYQKIRPLPEIEKSFLDEAIMLGLFSISLWRIKRFKERNLNPLMENSYRDLLTRAIDYFEMKNMTRKSEIK